MSNRLEIAAFERESIGRTAEQIRRVGYIPAVLYGHGAENLSLAIEAKSFGKILPHLSSSTLLRLNIKGEKDSRSVLISEMQRHPLTGLPNHVDFHQVKMTEKIRTSVPLVFEGESAAVKTLGGILVKSLDEIEVEALPQDLPEQIIVDISQLKTFEDRISIKQLSVGKEVSILTNLEEIIAVVTPPRSEAELEELEKEVEENAAEVKTEADEKKAAKEAEAAAEGVEPTSTEEK